MGSFLVANAAKQGWRVYWWRDGGDEVDFVVEKDDETYALEVKSGRVKRSGLAAFLKRYPHAIPLVIGGRNASVEDFLLGKTALSPRA